MKKAVYPGTFDPLTNGHLDVIKRGSIIFDTLIVSVGRNPLKETLFSVKERMEMIRDHVREFKNVEVDCFDGMLVDYLKNSRRILYCAVYGRYPILNTNFKGH